MAIQLPKPIADYFTAEREQDADAVARCYSDNAVLKDDGKTHSGTEAIKSFMSEVFAKFSVKTEPFSIATDGSRQVVTCHVEGNFPGSPIDLRYFFRLESDKIAELEITV